MSNTTKPTLNGKHWFYIACLGIALCLLQVTYKVNATDKTLTQATSTKQQKPSIKDIVTRYYSVYAQRADFDTFIDFYANDAVLTDVIQHITIEGKPALIQFFDWNNPAFKKQAKVALIIHEQIISAKNNQIVTSGEFTPFLWQGKPYPAMQFTTILTLNTQGKIIKQTDWIDYPASLR